MRILLINPSTEGYARSVTLPLGLLSIAAVLQKDGHVIRLYDRTVEKAKEKEVFDEFRPELVGISLVSIKSINDTLSLASFAKKKKLPVVVGGPLASELPDCVLVHRDVDIVSIGEGEETWRELVRFYEKKDRRLTDIAGIAYVEDGETILTAQRDFIDLATLPPIDWSLVNVPKYFQSSYGCDKMLYLYSAKGCPNSCTFCYNRDFHRCRYRKRPIGALLDEIKYLAENFGLNGVYFADELWCRSREEMHETCDALRSLGPDLAWGCQTRIGLFDEEDFRYMYSSGCRWVFFGVESGSKRMLKLMNKRIDYDKIVPTFADCKKAGLNAIGSFIVGAPDETVQDLRETVSLIEKLDTRLINLNYYILVPASDDYKRLVAEGRYPAYRDITELAVIDPVEKIEYKFCDIPDRDIRVIRSLYMWRSFVNDDVSTGKGDSFAKKVITDALRSMVGGGFGNFIAATFFAGMEFLRVFFYAHAFPSVVGKYIPKRESGKDR